MNNQCSVPIFRSEKKIEIYRAFKYKCPSPSIQYIKTQILMSSKRFFWAANCGSKPNKYFVWPGGIRKRRGSGWRCNATTPRNIEKVCLRLARNPERSIPKLAHDLNVSVGSMHTIIKKNLKMKPFKRNKRQDLTELQ